MCRSSLDTSQRWFTCRGFLLSFQKKCASPGMSRVPFRSKSSSQPYLLNFGLSRRRSLRAVLGGAGEGACIANLPRITRKPRPPSLSHSNKCHFYLFYTQIFKCRHRLFKILTIVGSRFSRYVNVSLRNCLFKSFVE